MNNDYKNRDYTMRGGKDAEIANKRQRMGEAQHSQKDAFVQREQNARKSLEGRAPMMEDRFMKMDASMMNNGAHAQKLARSITAGLDKRAYPVNGDVDESQD